MVPLLPDLGVLEWVRDTPGAQVWVDTDPPALNRVFGFQGFVFVRRLKFEGLGFASVGPEVL